MFLFTISNKTGLKSLLTHNIVYVYEENIIIIIYSASLISYIIFISSLSFKNSKNN